MKLRKTFLFKINYFQEKNMKNIKFTNLSLSDVFKSNISPKRRSPALVDLKYLWLRGCLRVIIYKRFLFLPSLKIIFLIKI